MYYVPDGTERCGYFECRDCGTRYLSLQLAPFMVCPYCGEEVDMEIGPDEVLPEVKEAAVLLEVISGAQEVEKMDQLLSLAISGGDYDWL